METIKRQCNVVMLPTNEKARIGEITSNLTMPDLFIMNDRVFKAWNTPYHNNTVDSSHLIGNNLYFTSDEEIKEGEPYTFTFETFDEIIETRVETKLIVGYSYNKDVEVRKKIIASTDISLGLPQPSTAFIEKYINEYNKGNIIERVMVDYYKGHVNVYKESIPIDCKVSYFNEFGEFEGLKVSKDNTITISKVKDAWSRAEVIALIDEAYQLGYNSPHSEIPDLEEMNELNHWISKNL